MTFIADEGVDRQIVERASVLPAAIHEHGRELTGAFAVLSHKSIRIRRMLPLSELKPIHHSSGYLGRVDFVRHNGGDLGVRCVYQGSSDAVELDSCLIDRVGKAAVGVCPVRERSWSESGAGQNHNLAG